MEKSEEEIGFSLCDEIEEEILLRLPAKTLLQFKYVCKTWYNKITRSSQFARNHLKHQRQGKKKLNLMLHGSGNLLQSVSCSSNYYDKDDAKTIPHNKPLLLECKNKYSFNVAGSCNGLLLVLATCTDICNYVDYVIYIWNPTTGEYKTLPRLLSFMPYQTVLGFGPDLTTTDNNNDYKVLLLETFGGVSAWDTMRFKVNMYTTQTNSWKILLQNFSSYGYFSPHPREMILAHNNLHYVADAYTTDHCLNKSIISFDLKDDKFRVLPMVSRTLHFLQVCALNGDLCAFSYTRNDCNLYCIWKMEKFGVMKEECWKKMCSIDGRLAMDKPITIISPLHVLEDGQILLYAKPDTFPRTGKPFIVSYHTENKRASFLVQGNGPFLSLPIVYEESLISPNAASTVEEE